jgi:hypothetical protein
LGNFEPTTETPYERPNEGIAKSVARDIDGRPTVAGDQDGVDRAVVVPPKGSRCQVGLVRLVEADPAARLFHRVTIDGST